MKLLLDTHIWLWAIAGADRLSSRVRRELSDPSNQLWLSPISIWEACVLHSKKRIELEPDPDRWFAAAARLLPTMEAPLTNDVAITVQRLNLTHRDPGDLFLVATANVFGLTLVTADATLIAAKCCPVLANR